MKKLEFRYLITAPHLNAHGNLHGGELMKWADECAGMHARKLSRKQCVTRHISQIDFISTGHLGDVLRFESLLTNTGQTSLTFHVQAVNDLTETIIGSFNSIVFVAIDTDCRPVAHGVTI